MPGRTRREAKSVTQDIIASLERAPFLLSVSIHPSSTKPEKDITSALNPPLSDMIGQSEIGRGGGHNTLGMEHLKKRFCSAAELRDNVPRPSLFPHRPEPISESNHSPQQDDVSDDGHQDYYEI